ncbi:predicted protein [Naegleria gruberi]|uniref:Predicted protein n=1 Tax=Naegleria gruberi TaxID=5762 RepID=D2W2B1_NAEGR|nr:uncharacterized protein NAEGRDRAFT_82123 [Naegleria gruberi]EFC36793.1 predicted protein [Naegleria gruberi]|eukprot:XP_002669537.1 predicted protein [Naegleria gruberi strain NEG-M]
MAQHENVILLLDISISSFLWVGKFVMHRKILKLIPNYPCLACVFTPNEIALRKEAIRRMMGKVPPMLVPKCFSFGKNEKEEENILEIILERDISIFDGTLIFSLRNNERICEEIVKKDGLKLAMMSLNLKSNENIVRNAVQQNGMALQFAHYKLRRNREIVCLALDQNGMALQYAAKELRQELEIVLRAVSQNGSAFSYAMCHRTKKTRSRRKVSLKLDPQVIETAVKSGAALSGYTKQVRELRENPNVALQCIRNGNSIFSVSVRLREDPEFKTLADQARNEFVQKIILSKSSQFLNHVSPPRTKTPYESLKELYINSGFDYRKDPEMIAYASRFSGSIDRERVLKSIRKIPLTLVFMDYYADEDEFLETALKYLDGSHVSLFETFFAKVFNSKSRMDLLLRSVEENIEIVKYLSTTKIVGQYEFMEKVIRIILKKMTKKPYH